MRYRFYVADTKVYCVSSYAGKAVRGVAKCDTSLDNFDLDAGKKLAQLRCDYKIAKKRVLRAREKHSEAIRLLGDAREYETKMQNYYDESFAEFVKLHDELEALEKSM